MNHVKHMAAGALAACVSRTAVAPFERVKMECILRQRGASATAVAAGVLRTEGILGFWRGNGLNILRTAPYKVSPLAGQHQDVDATAMCQRRTLFLLVQRLPGTTEPSTSSCLPACPAY